MFGEIERTVTAASLMVFHDDMNRMRLREQVHNLNSGNVTEKTREHWQVRVRSVIANTPHVALHDGSVTAHRVATDRKILSPVALENQ